MILTMTGLVIESYYKVQPETDDIAAPWRNSLRRRTEFPAADGALFLYLTPCGSVTWVFDDFPVVKKDGVVIPNDLGLDATFADLFLLHLKIDRHRQDLEASGSVVATRTDLFGAGEFEHAPLGVGDDIVESRAAGVSLISTSKLELAVTDPVNMAITLVLIGRETSPTPS